MTVNIKALAYRLAVFSIVWGGCIFQNNCRYIILWDTLKIDNINKHKQLVLKDYLIAKSIFHVFTNISFPSFKRIDTSESIWYFFICDSFCFTNVISKRLNVNHFEPFKHYHGFIVLCNYIPFNKRRSWTQEQYA